MNIRFYLHGLIWAVIFTVCASCRREEAVPMESPLSMGPLHEDTVARIHWLGRKRLGLMANAYYATRLWQLPESRALEIQTLQKLSVAPWRLLAGEAAAENAPAALLGPLLEDAVQEECYFEFRHPTNQTQQFVFAIRLDDQSAGMWRTNLVEAIADLTGIKAMDVLDDGRGWALKQPRVPNRFELARVNGWTVVGIGPEKNDLFHELTEKIRVPPDSKAPAATNWLEADLDFERMHDWGSRPFGACDDRPRLSIAVTGNGASVLTYARLTFSKCRQLELAPWRFPTNLIHEPLSSFTAIRGVAPFLSSLAVWNDLQPGFAPEQVYSWALEKNPFQSYVAVPMWDASNNVQRLTQRILQKANPWLTANGYVEFEPFGVTGVAWGKLPSVRPFFEAVGSGESGTFFGGLLPDETLENKQSLPTRLSLPVFASTNLLAYDWENTGQRVEAWLSIGEFVRLISRRAPLPLNTTSVEWLKNLVPRLEESKTVVTRTGTNQLTIERQSTLGFTGAELYLLADWLESPKFPFGLYFDLPPATHSSGP